MEIQTTQIEQIEPGNEAERKKEATLNMLLELRKIAKCPNPCPDVLEDRAPCTNCYAQKSVYNI